MNDDARISHRGRARQASCGGVQIEHELKFIADHETFIAAQALPLLGGPSTGKRAKRLQSTYFDTDTGDLGRHEVSLRVRRTRDGYVLGVKSSLDADQGGFERAEWEANSPTATPDLSLLGDAAAARITGITGGAAIAPVYTSDVRRLTRIITVEGATIEVAFDDGVLIAGDRRAPFHEIELELKSGEPAALYRAGLSLVDALSVTLGVQSKAERGARLADSRPPKASRAVPPGITPKTSIDEAIGLILKNCLHQFTRNWPALESSDAIEAIHQMRVALRRFRAALRLFGRAFPCAEFADLQGNAKRLAEILGQARDWVVAADLARDGPLARLGPSAGGEALSRAMRAKADFARAKVRVMIDDPGTTRFVLVAEAFVAGRGWRNGAGEETLVGLAEPVAPFAARSLDLLHHRVRKRGQGFEELAPPARHALRIALKRARYVGEFFDGLFGPASAVRRYAGAVTALQDLLGRSNDAVVALRLMKQIETANDAELAHAAGVVTGWCERAGLGDDPQLAPAWRALRKAPLYWRRGVERAG